MARSKAEIRPKYPNTGIGHIKLIRDPDGPPPAAPLPGEPQELPEFSNWLDLRHWRALPGDQDPATRRLDDPVGVASDYTVYGPAGEVLAKGTLDESGEKKNLPMPMGITNFRVEYEHDDGRKWKVYHEPYPNPFSDTTKPPSPAQIAAAGEGRIA